MQCVVVLTEKWSTCLWLSLVERKRESWTGSAWNVKRRMWFIQNRKSCHHLLTGIPFFCRTQKKTHFNEYRGSTTIFFNFINKISYLVCRSRKFRFGVAWESVNYYKNYNFSFPDINHKSHTYSSIFKAKHDEAHLNYISHQHPLALHCCITATMQYWFTAYCIVHSILWYAAYNLIF